MEEELMQMEQEKPRKPKKFRLGKKEKRREIGRASCRERV